ncbi:g8657 [Coccomyxa elongata]
MWKSFPPGRLPRRGRGRSNRRSPSSTDPGMLAGSKTYHRHHQQQSRHVFSALGNGIFINAPPGMVVHHKNNDKLDNRRSNLELTTQSHNVAQQARYRGRPERKM